MTLEKKIRAYILTLLMVSFIIFLIIFGRDQLKRIDKETRKNLSNVAFLISTNHFIQENLAFKNSEKIQKKVDAIVDNLDEIDMVVVTDITGKRYSHVNKKLIGQNFVGGDEKEVIEKGTSYFSRARGTLGPALRRFVPIYYRGEQIGFVMVGKLYWKIEKGHKDTLLYISLIIFIIFTLIYLAALLLAKSIKSELKGLEPREICNLYEENQSIFETLEEGIATIDLEGRYTKKNQAAEEILGGAAEPALGGLIGGVIRDFIPIYDREVNIGSKGAFVSLIPLFKRGVPIGIILTIKDSRKVTKKAEEITGVNLVIESLRANIHEFKNKLHVILGLLALDEVEEAKKFIQDIQKNSSLNKVELTAMEDSILNGLIIGKVNIAKEKGIELEVAESSVLWREHGNITTQDLIVIIGNLLENAIEASAASSKKKIDLFLYEDEDRIEIQVGDTGSPIEEPQSIYKKGYSTKGRDRGEGMSLVLERVEFYRGAIDLEQGKGKKTFTVILKKEGGVKC